MGLEGYLEDLGISDILQILSLSKKSGTLSLKNKQAEGAVSFIDGQVVRAVSTEFPDGLGQLLQTENLVTEEQVEQALAMQRENSQHKPLGVLLAENFLVSRQAIEAVVKQQIERIIFSFFSWQGGTFLFQLEEPESFGPALVNPFDFMLEKGIPAQGLVARGQQLGSNADSATGSDQGPFVPEPGEKQEEQDLVFLKGMLAELENPFLGGGIILLILRFASELMSRALVFDVRGRQLVGLGQFGLAGAPEQTAAVVRKLRLQIDPNSLFARVIEEQAALREPLGGSAAEQTLRELLGGVPEESFLGPLVSDGRVVALLYGDNFSRADKIGSTRAFEVFLSQAGIAMEQALAENPVI